MKKIYFVVCIVCTLFYGQSAKAQFTVDDKVAEEMTPIRKPNMKAGYGKGDVEDKGNGNGEDSKIYKIRSINDGDFVWGLSFARFTDSLGSPYKKSIDLYGIREILLADERLQLQLVSQVGYMSEPRKQWFADALHSTKTNITSVPGAFRLGLGAALNAIVLNRHVVGISVGPTAGIMLCYLPQTATTSAASNKFSQPLVTTPTMGLRANIYLFRNFYIGASYTSVIKSHFYNEMSNSMTTRTDFNGNFVSLSIGVRGLGSSVSTYVMPK